jgi:hypothetical protein
MMWEDMAELILSKKEIFEGVLRLLENNEEFGDSYNLMMKTRASTYSALFKTALKMDKDLEKQNMLSQTISKSKTIVEAILAPII